MSAFSHLPYRLGVGIILLNTDNLVFVAKRIDTVAEAWQMPQGGIDEGEDPLPAAYRELTEETSVTDVELIAESRDWLSYDLPDDLIPKLWKGRYRGQKQKWYAMKLIGDESQINLATDHPEFSEYKWIAMQELPSVIVPFKRLLYEQIVNEFSKIIYR